ncbi:MAG: hypothetical protein Q9216_001147 [Gyalolechia sp. 2 TL-2023]
MASSVFFRFKSQKDPARVAFDGTGISVFELKREIISVNRLGDGTDFELVINSEETGEVYDDDTYSIPRSTAVIAKRLPAAKPGRGGAARYVTGKMPQNAKTSHRADAAVSSLIPINNRTETTKGLSDMNVAQTEDEKIAAMFKLGADQWAQQQVEMANATPIYRSGPPKSKQADIPDRPPPQGYVCYRCGEKGHWIKACPTNDDPSYVNRPRVKRTTGIPKSFLKTVEKPTSMNNDGTMDDTKQPSGVMVNADGEWVVAEPDKASWDQYQARAKVSAAAQEAAVRGNKVLQERGLECPIDKHLFVEPSKTPCCQTTYCLECITNALLENDLRCPQCNTENILLDDLKPDDQLSERIREFEQEQLASQAPEAMKIPGDALGHKKPAVKQEDPAKKEEPTETTSDVTPESPSKRLVIPTRPLDDSMSAPEPSRDNNSRKRPADTPLINTRTPPPPGVKAATQDIRDSSLSNGNHLSAASAGNFGLNQTMAAGVSPVPNGFMNMPMSMMPSMPNLMGTYDPMMIMNPMMSANNTNWNTLWNGAFPQQQFAMANGGYPNGMLNGHFGTPNMQIPISNGFAGSNGMNMNNGSERGNFFNQQRNHFAGSKANEEDSAYFRKPVNPHRHQPRRNLNRPTDYREI